MKPLARVSTIPAVEARNQLFKLAMLGALATLGCGADDPSHGRSIADPTAPMAEVLATLEIDLVPGSQGPEVRALHQYLTRYGYFPNAKIAQAYPAWRPSVVVAPESDLVFDERTSAAVSSFQRNAGLDETGIVDQQTRNLLAMRRCGVPDNLPNADPAEKFAHWGPRWHTNDLTWRLTNTDDVSQANADAAVAAAFASWANETPLSFTKLTSGTPDIQLEFEDIDGPGNWLAWASSPSNGDIHIDTAETWSTASPTPSGAYDLQSVVAHEIGHSLGLSHSSIGGATMWPFASSGTQSGRTLEADDKVGISAIYDDWEELPGAARDIGVGADGTVWVIGESTSGNGYTINKWNGSGWTTASGDAVRVAVNASGVPWIVTSTGNIYRRSSSSATSGSWEAVSGCATDIGVGGGAVWILGCTGVTGGYSVYKWNGGSGWNQASGTTAGKRIAVDPTGAPWITDDDGDIFRRTSSSTSSGSWEALPGKARDIGVGPNGDAWVVGWSPVAGGYAVFVWNEQSEVLNSKGEVAAPARSDWIEVEAAAVSLSVGPSGPWLTDDALDIFRQED